MTDYPICIHSHIRFSNLKEEITDYRLEALVHGYEVSIDGFENYVEGRFFHDLKPFWDYTLDEVVDEEDNRYPNDKWLASICEIGRKFRFIHALKHGNILLAQLRRAWFFGSDNDIFHFDEETKVLTAYTSGWSGCEDIILALEHAFPWIDGQHAQLIFDMRYFFKEDGKE